MQNQSSEPVCAHCKLMSCIELKKEQIIRCRVCGQKSEVRMDVLIHGGDFSGHTENLCFLCANFSVGHNKHHRPFDMTIERTFTCHDGSGELVTVNGVIKKNTM